MVRPNPRYGLTNEDKFVDIDGYSRNLALEERLQREEVENRIYDTPFKGIRNPIQTPTPSWWGGSSTNIGAGAGYLGWRNEYTDQEVLEYLNIALKFFTDKVEYRTYQCHNYPRDPDKCQLAAHNTATVSNITRLIEQVKKEIAFDTKVNGNGFQLFPQVFAQEEPQLTLSDNIKHILNDINNNVIQVPEWFYNNIEWVQNGQITEQEFLTAYNYLADQQITQPITQEPITQEPVNESITDNMITQQVINFNIINGRAVGSIKFEVTNNFNSYYYGKNIVNLVQFKTPNGVTLLVKENRLNFTKTERDEIISYDESVSENTRIKVESFVWSSATRPTAFSKMLMIDIKEGDLPKITTSGFMSAGVAGAIAGLVLLGFIVDSRVGK